MEDVGAEVQEPTVCAGGACDDQASGVLMVVVVMSAMKAVKREALREMLMRAYEEDGEKDGE